MKKSTRRQKKRHVTSAFGVTGPEMEARRAGRLSTIEILKKGRVPLAIVELAEKSSETAEQALTQAIATNPPAADSACQKGCTWCCYKTVGTSAPEVLRIADYLRSTLSATALQATVERIIGIDAERRSQPPDKRGRAHSCSLLENGQCIAYPVRPLTCRGFNSSDARQCELSLDPVNNVTVPTYWPQQRLFTLVLDGVRSGLSESGVSGELLELTSAMRIALTQSESTDEWLAGKDVFATARLN